MLRTHGKISYHHTDIDMKIIEDDMAAFIENGVDGFVFGALTADREIDVDKCRQVIENARGLPITFHRAFDITIPAARFQNTDIIAKCGFTRLLSSGFAETAEQGIEALTEIEKYITEKQYNLILMPGCGVNTKNAAFILQRSGCKEFHASSRVKLTESIISHESDTSYIKWNIENNSHAITDRETVHQLAVIGRMFL